MFNCNVWLPQENDHLQHHLQFQHLARHSNFFFGVLKGVGPSQSTDCAHTERTSKCPRWHVLERLPKGSALENFSTSLQCPKTKNANHLSKPIENNMSKEFKRYACLLKQIGWFWKSKYLFGWRRRFWDTSNIKVVFWLRVCSHCTSLQKGSPWNQDGASEHRKQTLSEPQ